MKNFGGWFLLLFCLTSTILYAQSDGSITGTVKDARGEGKSLPGVSVRAKDAETGIETETQTNADGVYLLTPLRASTYDVTFSLQGFGNFIQEAVIVNVGSRVAVNTELTEGGQEVRSKPVAEEVEILANPIIETTQSSVSEVITEHQVANLPLNGRNFMELTFLTPGNVPGPGYDPTKGRVIEISSAGNLGRGGNILVDGSDNNDDVVGGVLQNFSEDAIDQFQVLTHRFSAELGRSSSSVVNISTKSGTNQFHGSGFFFYRGDALQAKNPLLADSTDEPPFDRQQVGFSAGGPIVKDKAFWFASLEYTNEDSAASAATRDVIARQIVPQLAPTPINDTLMTLRADYQANDANNLFGRYSLQRNNGVEKGFLHFGAPTSDVTNFQTPENKLQSGVFGWTKLFSSTKVNELHVAEVNFFNFIGIEGEPPELIFPSIQVGANFRAPQRTRLNRFQIKDDFTWTAGDHLFKFGGEFQRMDADAIFDLFGSGSVLLAEDFATQDRNGDGVINDNDIPVIFALRSAATQLPGASNFDNVYWAVYLQDDWRLRDNLTVNLGLRYELETQTSGANPLNLAERVIFYPGDTGQLRKRDKNNFGPRLGFAWDLNNDGKRVVRGGYGIYYDRIVLEAMGVERILNGKVLPIEAFGPSLLGDPFGGGAAQIGIGIGILPEEGLRNPRVQQFSIGFETEIRKDLVLGADYIGARGDQFIVGREVNFIRKGVQVNPDIHDSVVEAASIAKTKYDGLLITANKRFGADLQLAASYTLARARNWSNEDQITFTGSAFDIADPSKDEGEAEYQDRHRLVLNGIYQHKSGFSISGIFTYASGIPFNINTNHDFLGDGVNDRFPLLPRNSGGRAIKTGAELNELITLFNTSSDPSIVAMRAQCGCTLPLVDPGLKFTDNFLNLDLRFSKSFSFDRYSVEPLLELFNVFNVTNIRGSFRDSLAGYVTNMESPDFGKPVSTAGGVFGQGGPFAVQVAVKFKF